MDDLGLVEGMTAVVHDRTAPAETGHATRAHSTTIEPFIRKLRQLGPLSDADRGLLEELPLNPREVEPSRDLVSEGEQPAFCHLVLDGFACRSKTLQDGGRQITSFLIRGDLCGLTGVLLGRMDHSVTTLTRVTVASVPHTLMLDVIRRSPTLRGLLWLDTMIDAAISREWVVNIGRRPASERIAHLLCELLTRLRAAGIAERYRCDLPITQSVLADATGLSTVHVNRMMQELRGEGLIEVHGRSFVTLNWEGLKRRAGFDPAYLHPLCHEK